MNKVIGIISYLPEESYKRLARFKILKELIETCSFLFDLPMYIVTQCYTKEEREELKKYKNVILSENYGKLGILGARRNLREWFLESKYDYLIMLDDDCKVSGTKDGAKRYIYAIDSHPDGWVEFKGSQLKFFAISKYIFSKVDYREVNPEKEEGFEDTVFYSDVLKAFPKERCLFYRDNTLKETSECTKDVLSTWYTNQNLKEMLKKTEELKKI